MAKDVRLRAALDCLQAIYTLCVSLPENAELQEVLKTIHRLAGNALDDASPVTSTDSQSIENIEGSQS